MIGSEQIPLIVTLIPALIGAIFIARVFIQIQRPAIIGVMIGAVAGAFGAMLFMVPLSYCTFEPKRKQIDVYFGIFLIAIGTFLALNLARYSTHVFLSGRRRFLIEGQSTAGTFKGWLTPWLLLAPSLLILVLFLYYPAVDTFRLSTLLAQLGTSKTLFVCVDNFTRLLRPDGFTPETALFILILVQLIVALSRQSNQYQTRFNTLFGYSLFTTNAFMIFYVILPCILSATYYRVVLATFGISTAIVIISLIVSLAIAYMAYQPIRGGNIYRTLLIWPYAISPPVAGIIFFIVFNQTGGIANHIIRYLGGEGVNWIQDSAIAPWTIILASVWKSIGFSLLFYIAGLQNVPKDLLEAAAIDGANFWGRFTRITIPMLSPITFFLIITNISYAFFDVFGTIDFLTRGGPDGATSVMIYEIYQLGIINGDLGKSAAQSLILFSLVIGITYLQFRTTGRRVSYGA